MSIVATNGTDMHAEMSVPAQSEGKELDISFEYAAFDRVMAAMSTSDYAQDVIIKPALAGAQISFCGINYEIPTIPSKPEDDLWDRMCDESYDAQFSTSRAEFIHAIGQTRSSASQETSRKVLHSIYLEQRSLTECRLVATDAIQLAYCDVTIKTHHGELATGVMIPLRAVNAIVATCAGPDDLLTITQRGEYVKFQLEEAIVIARVVDGQFVQYERGIAREKDLVAGESLFRFAFLGSVTEVAKRISVIGKSIEDEKRIQLTFVGGEATCSAKGLGAVGNAPGTKRTTISTEIDILSPAERDVVLMHDWERLSEILRLSGDEAEFEAIIDMAGNASGALLCTHESSLHLLMPMRVRV